MCCMVVASGLGTGGGAILASGARASGVAMVVALVVALSGSGMCLRQFLAVLVVLVALVGGGSNRLMRAGGTGGLERVTTYATRSP